VGAIYNIGINLYMVLWAGAYTRTPIDLRSSKKFLEINNLSIPLIIYVLVHYLIDLREGYIFVSINGVLGFAFKGLVLKAWFSKKLEIFIKRKVQDLVGV
jgi:hypothetical protein